MTKKKGKDKKKAGKRGKAKAPNAPKSNPDSAEGKFRYTIIPSPSSLEYASYYSIFVDVKLDDGRRKQVGKIFGYFICRNNIRDGFWEKMQNISAEATSLAFDIFDRYGTVRDEFTVGTKSGTGVFAGTEMKERCILMYENIVIDETFEDTSFVAEMFQRIFDHGKEFHEGVVLAVVQPEPLNTATSGVVNSSVKKEEAYALIRGTDLDGTADVKDDAKNEENVNVATVVKSEPDVVNTVIKEEGASDGGDIDEISQYGGESAEVKEEEDPEEPESREPIWSTPEARVKTSRDVGFRRIGTSSWFGKAMNEKHAARSLDATEDYDPPIPHPGPSELEMFEAGLERSRTLKKTGHKFKDISDEFQGYPDDQATKLLTLRGVPLPVPAQVFHQAKFGCTCTKCIDGFLSPRMLFTLLKQAEKAHDKLYLDMSCDSTRARFKQHPELWQQQLEGFLWASQPARIIKEIFRGKDFALGLANVYRFVYELLKIKKVPSMQNVFEFLMCPKNTLPKEACPCCGGENISPEMSLFVYLERGGTFEAALKGLVDYSAMRDEKAGDDTFWWRDPRVKNWDFATTYHALPRCRNDSEFGFVFNQLCKK